MNDSEASSVLLVQSSQLAVGWYDKHLKCVAKGKEEWMLGGGLLNS